MPYEPTHIYYNVQIQNSSPNGSAKDCTFREQRLIPLIEKPEDYFFSCIRFQVPTSTIPILVVPVQPFPNTDTSKTIYSITLSYNGIDAIEYIKWFPNTDTIEGSIINPKYQLSAVSPYTNSSDNFYYCHSYIHFINLVNTAFKTAFTTLNVDLSGSEPPYFTYDAITKLFSLNAQESVYDILNTNPIKIYLNNDLYALLGGLNSIKTIMPVNGKSNQILISNDKNNTIDGIIKFMQEYQTLVSWIGFKSIVITTGTIPIISEGIPVAQKFFSNTNVSETGTPTFLNIVSDYDALLDAGYADFQTSFQYQPTSEYRLIDMFGTMPLTSFDISVFWIDNYANLHELSIMPNETASFKFMFRKKKFNL